MVSVGVRVIGRGRVRLKVIVIAGVRDIDTVMVSMLLEISIRNG